MSGPIYPKFTNLGYLDFLSFRGGSVGGVASAAMRLYRESPIAAEAAPTHL
jgi:hypothetical protein